MEKIFKRFGFIFTIFILMTSCTLIAFNPEKENKILNTRDNPYIGLKTSQNDAPFIVGTDSGPQTIDPVNCFDSASSDVIDQVAEGLFGYNLSDPALPRIPLLARSYWWQDTTHLQITLRQGVMFQDGAMFNSTSVKWNFDRIMYLTNATGTLPASSPIAEPASLFFFNITYSKDGLMMGGYPIIKSVTAVGEWNLTIVLYAPFAPFLDLLCNEASFMVSPKSTPADRFLNLDEKLVGTGPFTFDSYTTNVGVYFLAFDNYWQGKANITDMVFSIIQDPVTRNNAMLNHDIDYLLGTIPSLISTYESDPLITVKHFTDDTGIPGLSYYYLGFNNVLITQTLRKAMSYAIDYSYIIDLMANGLVVRANSPISPGYGSSNNASVKAADFNLAKARQVLLDAGVVSGLIADNSTTGSNADAWKALNLGSFNYSYNTVNQFRWDLLAPLQYWMKEIGITILDDGGTWDAFSDKLYVHHDQLGLYWVGQSPNYFDPFNMLDLLFNPASSSNSAQVNDPTLNNLLKTALKTTDQVARDDIYKHIQYYLANELYPHAFGYHPKITIVHSENLTNVPYNSLGKCYFYPCNWIPNNARLLPIIYINSPNPSEVFGSAPPFFKITIVSQTLDTTWYSFNHGSNIKFTGLSGYFDPIAWRNVNNGTVIITFYANNSKGEVGMAELTVYKNITGPIITINEPKHGDEFTTSPPPFNITINESHLDSIWYTIDNGSSNFTITNNIGTINSALWFSQPNGQIWIRFYANNTFGNIGSAYVVVYKNAPQTTTRPEIPGYNPILIGITMSIGIVGITWYLKQKQKII